MDILLVMAPETNAWIWCRGYAGCAHSKDTIQADNFIYCTGDESCYNSNVRSGTNIKCRGNSACVFGVLFSGKLHIYIYILYVFNTKSIS